jgi:hypothetical protein
LLKLHKQLSSQIYAPTGKDEGRCTSKNRFAGLSRNKDK